VFALPLQTDAETTFDRICGARNVFLAAVVEASSQQRARLPRFITVAPPA
jgi:hypothetical protein